MSAPTPEEYVDRLRALREEMAEVQPLTAAERKALRNQIITSDAVLNSSINIVDAHPLVQQSIARTSDELRVMQAEANRWTAVEAELHALLKGVSGANLIRRQRLSVLALQAYLVGAQLARDPAHSDLVPHVVEIRRLRRIARRRRADTPDDTPKE